MSEIEKPETGNVPDDCDTLAQAYSELQQKYDMLRTEYGMVIKTVIRSLNELGMWPVSENMDMSGLWKRGFSLVSQAMMPGSNLKDRFAFIKDIMPIAEKYKDIDINDL